MINRSSDRIESIDVFRGAVMVLMALDHARDYFGQGSFSADPTNLTTTTPILFFTRWITHYCAPVFVFLAGISAFLQSEKKQNTRSISMFLFLRGLWLVLLEISVINFGWTFDTTASLYILQVIMAIGISMVLLSLIIYLPRKALVAVGLALVAGHNLLDGIVVSGTGVKVFVWSLLHQQKLIMLDNGTALFIVYPVMPWIGLMVLGYACGTLYRQNTGSKGRRKFLLVSGLSLTGGFILLRYINGYGDPHPWSTQKDLLYTILSFINTTKYPPSLLYLMMTTGPALMMLYIFECWKFTTVPALRIIGRVPLFYYVLHIYLLHLLAFGGVVFYGMDWRSMILTRENLLSDRLSAYGYSLYIVYLVWASVVLMIYPFCKMYCRYKEANKDKKWLGFF
jgi:uncharacterized membrane protein